MKINRSRFYTFLWLILSASLLVVNQYREYTVIVLYGIVPFTFLATIITDRRVMLNNKGLNAFILFLLWASIGLLFTANMQMTLNYLSILLGNIVVWYSTYRIVLYGNKKVVLLLILGLSTLYHGLQGVLIPVEVIEKLGYGRATGVFENSNALGFMMWYGIVISTGMFIFRKNSLVIKLLVAAVLLLFTYVLISSGSRKNALAVLAFGAVLMYYLGKSKYRPTVFIVSLVGMLIYFTIGEDFFADSALVQRSDAENIEHGGEHRAELILEGINFFLRNPIMGIGLGSFTTYSRFNQMSHNDFIEVLASTGIVGILLYLYIYWNFYIMNRTLLRSLETYKIGAYLQAFIVGFLILGMGRPAFLDPISILILAFFQSLAIRVLRESHVNNKSRGVEKKYEHMPYHQHA